MKRFLLMAVLVFASQIAQGKEPWIPMLGGRGELNPLFEIFSSTYQIGSEWSKRPLSPTELRHPVFGRAARATARVGGGTGFFIGKFNGELVMATNHHVCPEPGPCSWGDVYFPLQDLGFSYKGYIGTWQEIDLTLFTIEARSPQDERAILPDAKNFDFSGGLRAGQKLLTIGFGTANNPNQQMMANFDQDCVVYSPTDEIRLMRDPDQYNPGSYAAWSYANGCDVSHGDSGSAMVDRITGAVVGIIWTGRIPKSRRIQDSNYLASILGSNHDDVWNELSYAVPTSKMREVLRATAENPKTGRETRAILNAILNQ